MMDIKIDSKLSWKGKNARQDGRRNWAKFCHMINIILLRS